MAQRVKLGGILKNDCLASISVLAIADQPGIAAAVLDALGQRNLNVQFVVQVIDHEQQDHLVLCVDRDDLPASLAAIETVRAQVGPAAVVANPQVAAIAIFGPDFRERPGIAGQMFRALASRGINILAISTSISTVTCLVDMARTQDTLAALHEQFDLP